MSLWCLNELANDQAKCVLNISKKLYVSFNVFECLLSLQPTWCNTMHQEQVWLMKISFSLWNNIFGRRTFNYLCFHTNGWTSTHMPKMSCQFVPNLLWVNTLLQILSYNFLIYISCSVPGKKILMVFDKKIFCNEWTI